MFELKAKIPIEKDLIIKVKDYDVIGKDDTIGKTTIDLENRLFTKFRASCGLPITYCMFGKLEMELELLTETESLERPAGIGRELPNENPHFRPSTSFFWLTSPWKTFRHIIWRNYKWYIITGIILGLLAAFVVIIIYTIPVFSTSK
ncbi:dysferlin-like [Octopus sinensis]|uniref:Dysferlin-like n=1 Tax=Octopus sinensis TaxID=2607531 RepID=A0A6P7U3W4_9MOLL|nr:dysferlin-like [Octopus sinensis]